MSQNSVSVGDALKKAIPSLVMFVVGFFITYKIIGALDIYCVIFGWLFGGVIWGWFIAGKWFSFDSTLGIVLRCLTAPVIGIVGMAIGFTQLIIAIVRAKRVLDLAKAARVENEQAESGDTHQR